MDKQQENSFTKGLELDLGDILSDNEIDGIDEDSPLAALTKDVKSPASNGAVNAHLNRVRQQRLKKQKEDRDLKILLYILGATIAVFVFHFLNKGSGL